MQQKAERAYLLQMGLLVSLAQREAKRLLYHKRSYSLMERLTQVLGSILPGLSAADRAPAVS